MVDLVYGRGITDIAREFPHYISLFKKMTAYRLFHSKQPMYGSVDVNNVCNLHCTHCYWWLNRKEEQDMTVEDWRRIIREVLNKRHIFITTLVAGSRRSGQISSSCFAKKCREEFAWLQMLPFL